MYRFKKKTQVFCYPLKSLSCGKTHTKYTVLRSESTSITLKWIYWSDGHHFPKMIRKNCFNFILFNIYFITRHTWNITNDPYWRLYPCYGFQGLALVGRLPHSVSHSNMPMTPSFGTLAVFWIWIGCVIWIKLNYKAGNMQTTYIVFYLKKTFFISIGTFRDLCQ